MFHLFQMLDVQSDMAGPNSAVNRAEAFDTPSPALSMLPLGSDNQTWRNVVRNKRNMLYCDSTFQTLGNRERCITDFSQSGLLD